MQRLSAAASRLLEARRGLVPATIVSDMSAPKLLADASAQAERKAALNRPHVAPLSALVARLRSAAPAGAYVPDFDPFDGGVNAECLFLLEAPGRNAVRSGFVSRNNPDETAKNFFQLNREAGLDRSRTIVWNVVPWYVGDGQRIRPVTAGDIRASAPFLRDLLAHLPQLKVAVLVGRKAQRANYIFDELPVALEVFHCPHPSPLSLNGRPERRLEFLRCLLTVKRHLDVSGTSAPNSP